MVIFRSPLGDLSYFAFLKTCYHEQFPERLVKKHSIIQVSTFKEIQRVSQTKNKLKQTKMAYNNTQEFIKALEAAGELLRIQTKVSTELEMCEIVDRMSKAEGGGKAILFENTGTDFPVLMNAMGSHKRICLALGTDNLDTIGAEIEELFKELTGPKKNLLEKLKMLPKLGQIASFMPKSRSGKGKCQEVIHENPDLGQLPVLKTWPADGGAFITFPCVNTKDPETGIRNVGMYRMQVFEKDLTGMHWHRHKVGARHYNEYKKRGEKMPIAVVLGGDPAYTYAATAPLPDNIDEYMLSGFLRKKKVELVQCITQPIEVPHDADIIIEGYVDPEEEFIWEGPFGDHTGYYSLADWYPRFHVTCITHRKDAVYPATIVGIPPMEDAWIALATERIFLAPIKLVMIPEFIDMDIPAAGVAHNLTIVQVEKTFPGQAQKVMSALWGAGQMMFNKVLVVVDQDAEIHNYEELARYIGQHVDPESDIHFAQGPLDVLDHSSSKFSFGGKVGIDATKKLPEEIRSETIKETPTEELTIPLEALQKNHPEITALNTDLLKKGIPVVLVAFKKSKPKHAKLLAKELFTTDEMQHIKMAVFVDDVVDVSDLMTAIWVVANNIDPRRDSLIIEAEDENSISHIAIDGTRKTSKDDKFQRDWPNIVTMDDATIKLVDERWAEYGLGDFIPSPSLKFKPLVMNAGAIVEE